MILYTFQNLLSECILSYLITFNNTITLKYITTQVLAGLQFQLYWKVRFIKHIPCSILMFEKHVGAVDRVATSQLPVQWFDSDTSELLPVSPWASSRLSSIHPPPNNIHRLVNWLHNGIAYLPSLPGFPYALSICSGSTTTLTRINQLLIMW